MACNAGDYSKAEGFLSADTKKLIHGDLGAMAGGIKHVCDEASKGGMIDSIDVKSEKIRGEGATVIADIHFKDKSVKADDKSELVRENGAWKLAQ